MKYLLALSLLGVGCLLQAETLGERLQTLGKESYWLKTAERPVITRTNLIQAIEMARAYYLNHQRVDGNFIYAMDISNGEVIEKDNQVRQAGALWGLACLNRDRFNEPNRRALLLGIDFFASRVAPLPNGEKCFIYPNDSTINTGTAALFALTLIEYLHGQQKFIDEKMRQKYTELLDIHLSFLRSMEMEDGSWAHNYNPETNLKPFNSSPYYDGEALLAYCKAARYLDRTDLMDRINNAIPKLIAKYTVKAWEKELESEEAKGFYQWGCMAFAEYVEAGWQPHAKLASDAAYALSWWQIHSNQIEYRLGNTAYAVEGLIATYQIAKHNGDAAKQEKLKEVALRMMSSLMTWQYQGPFMRFNPALNQLKAYPGSDGGIVSSKGSTLVRIDTHQHQTHAMLLMLKHLF